MSSKLFIIILTMFMSDIVYAQTKEDTLTPPMYGQGLGPRHGQMQGKMRGQMGMGWIQKLTLGADQLEKINVFRKNHQPIMHNLQQQLISKKQNLKKLYSSAEATNSQISLVQNDIQDLELKISKKKAEMLLQIRDILTQEQRAKLIQEMP